MAVPMVVLVVEVVCRPGRLSRRIAQEKEATRSSGRVRYIPKVALFRHATLRSSTTNAERAMRTTLRVFRYDKAALRADVVAISKLTAVLCRIRKVQDIDTHDFKTRSLGVCIRGICRRRGAGILGPALGVTREECTFMVRCSAAGAAGSLAHFSIAAHIR